MDYQAKGRRGLGLGLELGVQYSPLVQQSDALLSVNLKIFDQKTVLK